ncbi:aminotransferase-like domain-containing protein [Saccharothrix algeriensis]|uniref:2-aminoadipate transaminase n=1 Tax=Saccharothrix algeriensis TaxID=173560 RepID=A0ABS2SF63_9PSEU|nr:PLP-dependent aminotransferase family protein [Saccharothrix algeriensis]MBM7814912.1 2-aminoadipate transaminase [Saccharothrix algeriensis]
MTTNGIGWQEVFARHVAGDTGDEITAILKQAGGDGTIAFSGGFPHPRTFPRAALEEGMRHALEQPAGLQYGPTAGLPGLRDWFAGWLERHDGARPAEEELIVTSGGMEGLGLVVKSLLDPGDRVLVEGPTFMGALVAFQRSLARVEAVPVDADGLDVDALAALLAGPGPRPKLLYTIPDYQNPTGVSLSTPRRRALVELARRHGLLLVEDVAYRELGFDGERRPSLWSLAPEVVAQVGTFSKTFTPGMRLGWVAAPAPLVEQLVRAKQNTDQCTSGLAQLLLEGYGRSGRFDAGIAASRSFYAARNALMTGALAEHLPADVAFTRATGGFFSWLTAPDHVDQGVFRERAREAGVTYVPGTAFYPDRRGGHELRLSYSRVDDDLITEGVRRLAAAYTAAARSATA